MTTPLNDEQLRAAIRKEIQSLKNGLDTNALNEAKITWCVETEDNIIVLFHQALAAREVVARITGATTLAMAIVAYDWQLEDSINANDVVAITVDSELKTLIAALQQSSKEGK